jgi:ketosteroid isomerase-like protein
MRTDAASRATGEALERFNEAFNRHDVAAVMAHMTEDCVFENTFPAPDGERFQGQGAVHHFWEEFFQSSPDAVFEAEETLTFGDRAVIRWRYHWTNADGSPGHVRGVDVLRVADGKIAEKLAYVKG